MIEPRPYQKEAVQAILDARKRGVARQLVVLPTGCHEAGTQILMRDGTMKAVEDVAVGDQLMGPDSTPRNVLRLIRGVGSMYKVIPTKGEPFVVNEDHILSLEKTNERADPKRIYPCTKRGFVNISVREYLGKSATFKHMHKLYRRGVEFPEREEALYLAPYFLGVLLGDGCFANGCLMVTTPDDEIVEECFAQALNHDLEIRVEEMLGNEAKNYHFVPPERRRAKKRSNEIREALRSMGLLGLTCSDKFVPERYKLAGKEERFQVLAGLLDTDGTLCNNVFEFSSKSLRLAEDVVFLARSLGLAAYRSVKIVKDVEYQRVNISGEISDIPTRIERKRAALRQQKKSILVSGFRVEPVGTGEYFGFELDGDRLYLMGDFTVTHNSGKTICFGMLAKALDVPTIVLAHREELLNQAKAKIRMVWPEGDVGILQADRLEGLSSRVCVASVQTAITERRLDALREKSFRLMVVDEAHHATAESYMRLMGELGFLADDPEKLLVGVTATGYRGDGVALSEAFQEVVFERSIMTMIRAEYLCDAKGISVSTKADLSQVHTRAGDFALNELSDVIDIPERNDLVARSYVEHASARKGVVFCCDVKHSMHMAESLRNHGVKAEAVYGDMDRDERRVTLERFDTGPLDVLTNCNVLTEGWDAPATSAILLARPTKSPVLYTQMVGRGLRRAPMKTDCLVMDFVDTAGRHSLCSLATLAGNPRVVPKKGETLSEAYDRVEREEEQAERVVKLKPKTAEFELFEKSKFIWSAVGEHFKLSMGKNHDLFAKRVSGGYVPLEFPPEGDVIHLSEDPLPLGYAMGVCEDHCRQYGRSSIAMKNAPWRKNKATEKQIDTLKRLGVPHDPDITAGEASALLQQKLDEPATSKQKYTIRKNGLHPTPDVLTKAHASRLIGQWAKERKGVAV